MARIFGCPPLRLNLGNCRLTLDSSDYFQVEMYLGLYETETTDLLNRILRAGDVYVDVGAQIGFLAAHVLTRVGDSGAIYAFDPDPRAFTRLRSTFESTPNRGITLLPVACSDEEGSVELHLAPVLGQSSTVGEATDAVQTIGVQTITLDGLLAREKINRVRLIKIDAEGHEIAVLRGAMHAIKSKSVDFFLVEKNPGLLAIQGYDSQHLHAMLAEHGYLGAHSNGQAPTEPSLATPGFENLLYARNEQLMREAYPGYSSSAPIPELQTKFEQAAIRDHPCIQANQIIRQARLGDLARAINSAEVLLRSYPDLNSIRAHLAYWYEISGAIEHAKRELEILLQSDPANIATRQSLERLRAGRPASR